MNTIETTRRQPTIADVMILVMATALALMDLSLSRYYWESPWNRLATKLSWGGLFFTLALIVIRLRKPRPDRDDFWRQPGWIACVTVAIAIPFEYLRQLVELYQSIRLTPVLSIFESLLTTSFRTASQLPNDATILVAVSWTILALGGRWKSDPGWIDRAGRLIGVYWIVLGLATWGSRLFI